MVNQAASFNTNKSKAASLSRTYTDDDAYTKPSTVRVAEGGTIPDVTSQSLGDITPIFPGTVIDDFEDATGWTINGTNFVGVNQTINKTATNALYIEKSDASSATVEAYNSYTAFDFSSDEFWMYLFVSSEFFTDITSAGVEIRLRNDASNYYSYVVAKTSLASGWNTIHFAVGDATGVGTPNSSSLTDVFISFDTTNAADVGGTDDFVVDNFRLIADSDKVKNMISGYPQVSEATRQVTFRAQLSSVQGVGANIDRVGYYNTDGTPVLWGVDIFPAESKGIADEFNFTRRNIRP